MIFRFGPIAFGLMLGWMLFNPPAFLADLGALRWLINLGLCLGLFLLSVPLLVLANLPESIKIEPATTGDAGRRMQGVSMQLESLGFTPAAGPLRVHISPSAIVLGFVHSSQPIYATVFETTTVPKKMTFDFVSIAHDGEGGLTTGTEPDGAVLPASAGAFRQVFPTLRPDKLFQKHLDGLEYLRSRGVHMRALSADMFQRDLSSAIAKQRQHFLKAPIRGSLLTLWRASTKKIPFLGPIQRQSVAAQQIKQYLAGSRAGVF